MRAKARQHKPGEMNKNEADYARELEHRQRDGEIVRYRFEPMKFRLADLALYNFRQTGPPASDQHILTGARERIG